MLFVLLIGLLLCTGHPVSSFCPVEIRPTIAVVRYGDPFSANCSSLSNQTEGMGWEAATGGTPLTHGISVIPLNIDSVSVWTLTAQCFINQIDGEQCSKILPFKVYKTPDSVSVSQNGPQVPIKSGQGYEMRCDIVNVAPVANIVVHWYHENNLISTVKNVESQGIAPVNKSVVLPLNASNLDNGTQIWCEVELDLEPKVPDLPRIRSMAHEVIVLYPPDFREPGNETVEIRAGGMTSLNCTATGNPRPGYRWQLLNHIQETNMIQTERQPILIASVSGTYACTVSNTQGTARKYFTVTQAKRERTTFAALVGGFVTLGALLFVGGLFFMTPEGTFAFGKGQPTSSKPV